ncbi:hypothetical protein LINPERHAP1_LOCUS14579 [Linum perenne]
MIAWDMGYKKVHLQLDSLAVSQPSLGIRKRTPDMVGRSTPSTSSVV